MIPQITLEMRSALSQRPGRPVAVEDPQSQHVYFLVDAQSSRTLFEQWLREEIERGLRDIDQGNVVDLDINAMKAEARRRMESGE